MFNGFQYPVNPVGHNNRVETDDDVKSHFEHLDIYFCMIA